MDTLEPSDVATAAGPRLRAIADESWSRRPKPMVGATFAPRSAASPRSAGVATGDSAPNDRKQRQKAEDQSKSIRWLGIPSDFRAISRTCLASLSARK